MFIRHNFQSCSLLKFNSQKNRSIVVAILLAYLMLGQSRAWASETLLRLAQIGISLCCGFRGDKTFTTRWSGGRVQVWVQIWAPVGHLAISPNAVPEGNRRFRGQNQLSSSWGHSPALLERVRRANKYRAFPRRLQSLLAAPSSLEPNILPLVQCWLSSRVKKVLRLCKFWPQWVIVFYVKWNFRWNWQEVVADQSPAHCFAQYFDQSLVLS